MNKLDFFVLGSGSSGNCSLLRLRNNWVMIDAGFSMKQTKDRMRTHNVQLDDVQDVVVTHFDRDHFNPVWCRTFLHRGIRVHLHEHHVTRAKRAGLDDSCIVPFNNRLELHGIEIEAIRFSHDALGTVGFIFDTGRVRLGYATDLGRVPQQLLDRFIDLDAIAFESNYDPTMQRQSNRPESLKSRIMDGDGHLSNEESIAAICHIASESTLQHIVLLHLSRQCNSPQIIRDLYLDNLPHLQKYVTITSQERCSRLLSIEKEPMQAT
ncbi:MAG: MBL fold metallo-hydrolase [Phycisphaerales bacterium]|nr:MBL fold metallo-hydrolase [Planctomycetota bacterium]MBL6997355.1 MBL fold metallo-hydrolase [Phycisphaerales bacterium]